MIEKYEWKGFDFLPPTNQEVFYSTTWFKGFLGKGKQHDPNTEFDCLWRYVDTSHRITGKNSSSSNAENERATLFGKKVYQNTEKAENSEVFEAGSQLPMGSPKPEMTPTPPESTNLLNLASLEKVRSEKSRLTIAYDCEFFYEEEPSSRPVVVDSDVDNRNDPKKVRHEKGKRNITSYQFSLYDADGIHVMEVVFLVKPIAKKDGTMEYKKLMLSQALGAILDLCTFQQNHVFEYKDTRRWQGVTKQKDGTLKMEYLFKSPEEALDSIHAIRQEAEYKDCVIDTSNVAASIYKNVYSEYMSQRAIPITILCHYGLADLSAFAPERGNRNILKMLTAVQGGLVSMKENFFRATHRDYWKFYPCMVSFRDTMCFASDKQKKLENLGNALKIPKIVLPDGAISNMGKFLKTDFDMYMAYASNDALITLVYASRMWGINKEMPVTASSAAAHGAYMSISEYMGVASKAEYQLAYSGLVRVSKGKEKIKNKPGYLDVSNLEPYCHRANLLLNTAANSYKGGFNGCSRVGWFDTEQYFDYDLQNAYPTAMCNVFDIDFRLGVDPLEYAPICQRYLTLDDFQTPFDPLFAYIRFEFPKDVLFPCIAISHNGSLVFPRTSEGLEGAYACGPDIYLALRMGAKVFCIDGYRGRIRRRADGSPSKSLGEAVRQLVKDRSTAKNLFGKKSIEELLLKIMVNSIYGKTAQNVIQKNTWDGLHEEYTELGTSIITSPVHAAVTTAAVRCVLIAAMNQLEALGYRCYSVTTDGFISNAPLDVLSNLDLYGFADVFKNARLFLTKGKSDAMWEAKHSMDRFLNLSTRANVSPDLGGVCAHGGLVTGEISDTLPDRTAYIAMAFQRTKSVPSIHKEFTNLKTMLTKGVDFHSIDCITNISLDFDMKRKPLQSSLRPVWVNAADGSYQSISAPTAGFDEIACIDTIAFDSIAEYELYRKAKESCPVLRTFDDWKLFFVKARRPANSTIRISNADWTSLMSCIILYRQGKLDIPPLNACTTVQEKIKYINSRNKTDRKFTESHWKNARRPERASSALPIEALSDTLQLLLTEEIS